MAVYQTNSAQKTKALGQKIAKNLPSQILALTGDLGSGKTTFVKGLAQGLGIKKRILSPSFTLIRQYGRFYHFDLYRLEDKIDIKKLGLEEIWQNPYNIIAIEWAEKIKENLSDKAVWIDFQYLGKNKRKIEIKK